MNLKDKVFISYSHDNDEHKEWVHDLISKLEKYGVQTVSDKGFPLGGNLIHLMNKGLEECYRVIVICTDTYIKKANSAQGGAGYESHIVSAMILANQSTTKFVPLLRNVTNEAKTPTALAGRNYIDFGENNEFDKKFAHLVKDLTGNDISKALRREKFAGYANATSYFDVILKKSFPDAPRNTLTQFGGEEAVKRLDLLFQDCKEYDCNNDYIWSFRGGDYSIKYFEKLSDTKILLNQTIFTVDYISVYSAQAYHQSFIYFDILPEDKTGLYTDESFESMIKYEGYAWEEYGIYQGEEITFLDCENGATIINGSPVSLNGKAERRMHYVTPYNFILAASDSPLSSEGMRRIFPNLMNQILNNDLELDAVTNEIFLKQPKKFLF